MKVVLFCGGLGMRLRDYSEKIPKPMVPIGHRPVLWHVMKYYAHFGHTDFVLCLGYRSDAIKEYFINYREYVSNDFVLTQGGESVQMLGKDIQDWRITFVDTGYASSIGERLRRVREHVQDEEMFLANYSDNVTDFHLPDMVGRMQESNHVAGFVAVKPPYSFHMADYDEDGTVTAINDSQSSQDLWINGGYFVLRGEIFDHMRPGEELVIEPFKRLIEERRLLAMRHEGFWQNMDTFKDKSLLDELHARGLAPWEIWRDNPEARA